MIMKKFVKKWKAWNQDRAVDRYIQHLEDEAQKPRLVVPGPRRPLTPAEPASLSLESSKYHCFQQQSLLLDRLSFDVRRLVYEKILVSKVFHILRKGCRLGYLHCYADNTSHSRAKCWGYDNFDGSFRFRYIYGGRPAGEFEPWYNGDRSTTFRTDGGILPILLTCKIIYSEFLTFLYSENTFGFWETTAFASFLSVVPSRRLAQIRSLHLALGHVSYFGAYPKRVSPPPPFRTETEWLTLWASVVEQLPGLKSLEVLVLFPPAFWFRIRRRKRAVSTEQPDMTEENNNLVAPFRNFQHVNRVEIVLPQECRPSQGKEANVQFRYCELQERVDAIFGPQSQINS